MRLFNLWHRVRWGAEPQCSTDVWSWMSTKNKRRYGSEAAWYFLKWSEATTLCDKQRTLESLQLQAEPWIRGARYVTMSFWCHCMEHLQHNSRWYRGILEVLHFWTHLIWGFSWRASPTSRCLGHLIIKICCANRRSKLRTCQHSSRLEHWQQYSNWTKTFVHDVIVAMLNVTHAVRKQCGANWSIACPKTRRQMHSRVPKLLFSRSSLIIAIMEHLQHHH